MPETYGFIAPPPLPPPATGDANVDAALAKLMQGIEFIYDKKLRAAAKQQGLALIVPLLSDVALEIGATPYDEKKRAKLGLKERKAYDRIYQDASSARNQRMVYLKWLIAD